MTVHSPIIDVAAEGARKLRVAVFIEHDIIYRHFVQSGVFKRLQAEHDVTFIFPEREPANKRLTLVPNAAEVGAPMEFVRIDPARLALWRRLFQVSQLRWRPGRDWAHMRKVARSLVGPRGSKLYTVLALPGIFRLYQTWSLRQIARRSSVLDPLLDRLSPDVIVHPTVLDGYFINDVIMLGRARNIPTIAIMNSWDNPSTKRAVIGQPDRMLVWGSQTRDHAVRYMGMAAEDVICFGAAQFDIFRQPPRLTREEFCRRQEIDPAKPILLYAGSSKGSDEFQHLRMIERSIDEGALPPVTVVYRPHPWGRGGYKGERFLDYHWRHVCIEASMRDYLDEIRAGRKPIYLADYSQTHDVLASVDAVVSPLSTIILEAMLHGKPVLCFLPDLTEGSSFELQAKLVHFKELYANREVLVANGDSELISSLAVLLARLGKPGLAEALVDACAEIVTPHARSYPVRLSELVASMASVGKLRGRQ